VVRHYGEDAPIVLRKQGHVRTRGDRGKIKHLTGMNSKELDTVVRKPGTDDESDTKANRSANEKVFPFSSSSPYSSYSTLPTDWIKGEEETSSSFFDHSDGDFLVGKQGRKRKEKKNFPFSADSPVDDFSSPASSFDEYRPISYMLKREQRKIKMRELEIQMKALKEVCDVIPKNPKNPETPGNPGENPLVENEARPPDSPSFYLCSSSDKDDDSSREDSQEQHESKKLKKVQYKKDRWVYLTGSGDVVTDKRLKAKQIDKSIERQASGEIAEVMFREDPTRTIVSPRFSTHDPICMDGGTYYGLALQHVKANDIEVHGARKCIFVGNGVRLHRCQECTVIGDHTYMDKCNRIVVHGDDFETGEGCSWILAKGITRHAISGIIYEMDETATRG